MNISLFCMKVGLWPLKGILLSAMMGLFNYANLRGQQRPHSTQRGQKHSCSSLSALCQQSSMLATCK